MKYRAGTAEARQTSLAALRIGLSARVRTARKRLGLTQCELADMLSTSQNTVSNIERGECLPSATLLLDLKLALGVSADWMLDGGLAPAKAPEARRLGQCK